MPIDNTNVGWATTVELDPINGQPNREPIAIEVRVSGWKNSEGVDRQTLNELFYTQGQAIITVQDEAAQNLADAIQEEEDSRSAADNQLQNNIEAEADARILADSALQGNIDAEEASRVAADNSLSQALITTEDNLQTQLTALSEALISLQDKVIPKVGDTWITKSSQDPVIRFGVGTWNLIKGRVLVGLDEEDADFDLTGKSGGSKVHNHTADTSTSTTTTVQDHVLSESELPPHSHNALGATEGSSSVESLEGNAIAGDDGTGGAYTNTGRLGNQLIQNTGSGEGHNHPASSSSESITTVNNTSSLPPYEVVYIWERVA